MVEDDEPWLPISGSSREGRETVNFIWPSGGKTVLVMQNSGPEFDGVAMSAVEREGFGRCYPNSRTARVGGGEFTMLVRATSQTELGGKMDALRRFLDRSLNIADMEVNVGASIGAAMCTDGQTFEDLLSLADFEMYRQKAIRRVQVA